MRSAAFRGNLFSHFLKASLLELVLTNCKTSEAEIESCLGKKLNLDKIYKKCLSCSSFFTEGAG